MTIKLKKSTASQEIPLGPFLDDTDGKTAETALTIANTDIKIWKTGATTLANKNSGGATHMANGIYYAVLDATDTDTSGPMVIFVHVAGALPVRVECEVILTGAYDSLTNNLAAELAAIQNAIDAIKAKTDNLPASPSSLTAAQVNAEVLDVLSTDTFAEPTGAPGATVSLAQKIGYLYMALRNKITITSSAKNMHDDAGNVEWSKALSDDGTTYTENEGA